MGLKSGKDSKEFQSLEQVQKDNENQTSSFEKVLEDVGSDCKYQNFLIFGFMLPLAVCNSLGSANTTLLLTTPHHSCHVPGKPAKVSLDEWKNLTVPWEEDKLGRMKRRSCEMFNISAEEIAGIANLAEEEDYQFSSFGFFSRSIINCQYGWDFDNSSWQETPVSRFGWVCEDSQFVTQLFSLAYAGNAVGTFLFSIISDRFGRKKTFFAVLLLNVVCSVSSIFAPSFLVYAILKFSLGLAYYSLYQIPYIIVIELCNEKLRNFTAVSSFMACVLGTCLVSLVAYLSAHWKLFVLICHSPSLLFLVFCRFLPESPRWLLSNSRVAECERTLKKIAKINGRSYTDETRSFLLEAQKEETKKGSLRSIFTSWVLAKHLILTCLILSISYILYSGMLLNIHNLTGNKVLNFFILALVEIPGNVLGSFSSQYFGRRLSAVAFSALSAMCCVLAVFVATDEMSLSVVCALTKMFSGALVLAVYMQIGELFPTPLRSTAYGVTAVVGIAAVILIPPVISMGGSNEHLHYYILFGFGLLGIVLSSFLPETIGMPLPQTTIEAVNIGRNQPYFSIIHKWNVQKYRCQLWKIEEKYRVIKQENNRDDVVCRYEMANKDQCEW